MLPGHISSFRVRRLYNKVNDRCLELGRVVII